MPKPASHHRLQRAINGVLIVVVVLLAARVSTLHKRDFDWTAGNRNTLSAGSQQQLAQMPDEVRFLVFDYPGAETRPEIEAFVARYQRVKAGVRLEFIDPGSDPVRTRHYNVQRPGEVVLEYQGRHESIAQMSEPVISAALQRLADAEQRYVLFLQGHGERSLDVLIEETQYDLSRLREALTDKGLKVMPLNLVASQKIPDNASALVIATPTQTLLDAEIVRIREYLEAGGNLLWLADPDHPPGLEEIARLLGVQWLDGTVILPDYAKLGAGSPVEFFATRYPPNPVVSSFRSITSYPLARALRPDPAIPAAGWTYTPIVETDDNAWLETGRLDGTVRFDPDAGDLPGPLTIGLAMTRELPAGGGRPKRVQRVALFGDGDFLSDLMLSRYGNRPFATTLIQWLSSRDAQIDIEIPKAPDVTLNLPPWALWLYGAGFTAGLPLLLFGIGIGRWLIRRRR